MPEAFTFSVWTMRLAGFAFAGTFLADVLSVGMSSPRPAPIIANNLTGVMLGLAPKWLGWADGSRALEAYVLAFQPRQFQHDH